MGSRTLRARQLGVSMIEAMLTTVIAGVLTTAAVPAMNDVMTQQRLGAAGSDLIASLHMARSEAVRRNSPVAVVPADRQDWSSGWTVFADRNDDGIVDADEERIVERPALGRDVAIRAHFGATYPGKVLSYSADGRLHRPGGQGLVIGRLVLSENGAARSICFASLGFRMVAAPTCE